MVQCHNYCCVSRCCRVSTGFFRERLPVLTRGYPRTEAVSFLVLLFHKSHAVGVHVCQDGPDELGKAGVQPLLRRDRSVPQVYAGGNRDPFRGKLVASHTCMSGLAHINTATGLKQGTTLTGILPVFSRSIPSLQAPSCSRDSLRSVGCYPRTRIHACAALAANSHVYETIVDGIQSHFHPHGVCHGVASVGVKPTVGTKV